MNAAEAVATYGASWDETDEDKRRALLEKAWATDGLYIDPSGRADGREALVKHIAGFQQTFAGHRIELTSGVADHNGYVSFAWTMRGPDNNVVMEGCDFGELDDDGKLKLIVGFFGPWPEKG